jgi:hypothetical protein
MVVEFALVPEDRVVDMVEFEEVLERPSLFRMGCVNLDNLEGRERKEASLREREEGSQDVEREHCAATIILAGGAWRRSSGVGRVGFVSLVSFYFGLLIIEAICNNDEPASIEMISPLKFCTKVEKLGIYGWGSDDVIVWSDRNRDVSSHPISVWKPFPLQLYSNSCLFSMVLAPCNGSTLFRTRCTSFDNRKNLLIYPRPGKVLPPINNPLKRGDDKDNPKSGYTVICQGDTISIFEVILRFHR